MHACLRGHGFDVLRPGTDTGDLHINLYLSISVRARANLLWRARACAKDVRANVCARASLCARACVCAGARICPHLSARARARAKSVRANSRLYLSICVCVRARICLYLSARGRVYAGPRAQNRAGVTANTSGTKNNAIYKEKRVQTQQNQKIKKWCAAPVAKIAWRVPRRNFPKLAVPGGHQPGDDNCTG